MVGESLFRNAKEATKSRNPLFLLARDAGFPSPRQARGRRQMCFASTFAKASADRQGKLTTVVRWISL